MMICLELWKANSADSNAMDLSDYGFDWPAIDRLGNTACTPTPSIFVVCLIGWHLEEKLQDTHRRAQFVFSSMPQMHTSGRLVVRWPDKVTGRWESFVPPCPNRSG